MGLLLSCFVKVGVAILAGWGGYALGMIFYEAVLFRAEQEWLFYVTIVLFVAAAAILAFVVYDLAAILATSSLGSYGMVVGISAYAGHYYSPATMAQMFEAGLLDDVDPWYWAYVCGFALMTLIGFCFQNKSLKKEKAEEERKKHPYHAQDQMLTDSSSPKGNKIA